MQQSFEQLLLAMVDFVERFNADHAGGIDFGIGKPLYPAEIHTAVAIEENEGINITQLARRLEVSKPTISECIKRLVRKGVVKKEIDPSDAKGVTLWLEPAGRVACANHAAHHQRMFEMFCSRFGNQAGEKIDSFRTMFLELSEMMKQSNEHGA